jgi:hypothetical protein
MLLTPLPFAAEVRLVDRNGEFTGAFFILGSCFDGDPAVSSQLRRGIQSGT